MTSEPRACPWTGSRSRAACRIVAPHLHYPAWSDIRLAKDLRRWQMLRRWWPESRMRRIPR